MAQRCSDATVTRIARDIQSFLKRRRAHPIKLRKGESIHLNRIVAPAVNFGLAQLRASPIRTTKITARSVWPDLAEYLSSRLAFALGPVLRLQDAAAKAVARSEQAQRSEITLYESIVAFPEVLDLAARIISNWVLAQIELLRRLVLDKHHLAKNFLARRRRVRIIHIRPGLSDPHESGRTAALVEFAGGERVVYKPRAADREQLWFESLRWLNRNGFDVRFRIPKLLARNRYCWMEFIPPEGCKNLRAVRNFYFRWGAQAALAQILSATDLHRENWIAAGSQPVLVDAELIGDAEVLKKNRNGRAGKRTLPLILQTGLLPLMPRDRVGSYKGLGPFDSRGPQSALPNCWPQYKRVRQMPRRYVSELVRGHEFVAKIFRNRTTSEKFFRDIIVSHKIRNKRRVLFRASAQYARLLRASLEPVNMVSSEARWQYLENVCSNTAENAKIALAEAQALFWCDVPKIERLATTLLLSWKRFSAAVVQLQNSTRLFRSRIILGVSVRSSRG